MMTYLPYMLEVREKPGRGSRFRRVGAFETVQDAVKASGKIDCFAWRVVGVCVSGPGRKVAFRVERRLMRKQFRSWQRKRQTEIFA
jgi:hypothetical protein